MILLLTVTCNAPMLTILVPVTRIDAAAVGVTLFTHFDNEIKKNKYCENVKNAMIATVTIVIIKLTIW